MKYIWDEETCAVRVFFPQNAKDQADLERIRENENIKIITVKLPQKENKS